MNNYIEKIQNDPVINLIMPYLKGYKAYLVGGFIRDLLMGYENFDRDIVVEDCDIEKLSFEISKKLEASFVPLDTENKIYRVVLKDKTNYIDFAAPIENNIEKDILRRDLTLNAIAFDLNRNEFIDLTGGLKDIENQVIKGISEQNFIDDPLRLLRIFRFYSKLGFKIDDSLSEIVKKHSSKILNPAKERINTELIKLFEGKYADLALKQMDSFSLLELIFPIMKAVKTVPNNPHHHLDLFNHSIETVKQVQLYYEDAKEEVKEHLDSNSMGNAKRLAFLKLAAFCHDIGKPTTWTIEEETKKHRFFKHDDVGSKLVCPILKELKFSKKQIAYVQKLIKYHIYPSAVVCNEDFSDKSQMKFYRKMETEVIDVIAIAVADRLSAQGPEITEEITSKNISGLSCLLNNYIKLRDSIKPLPKLLDGLEIMQIKNLEQGKSLGVIIKKLKEAQLAGDITSREEAIEFINRIDVD